MRAAPVGQNSHGDFIAILDVITHRSQGVGAIVGVGKESQQLHLLLRLQPLHDHHSSLVSRRSRPQPTARCAMALNNSAPSSLDQTIDRPIVVHVPALLRAAFCASLERGAR